MCMADECWNREDLSACIQKRPQEEKWDVEKDCNVVNPTFIPLLDHYRTPQPQWCCEALFDGTVKPGYKHLNIACQPHARYPHMLMVRVKNFTLPVMYVDA